MNTIAYGRDLLKDLGVVFTAAICGFAASIPFGFPGLAVGVISGAGLGTWLFGTSSQVRSLENRVTELEAEHDRRERT